MNFAAMDKETLKLERLRLEADITKARSNWVNERISTSMNVRAKRDADLAEVLYLLGRMEVEGQRKRRNDALSFVVAYLKDQGHGALIDAAMTAHKEQTRQAREATAVQTDSPTTES